MLAVDAGPLIESARDESPMASQIRRILVEEGGDLILPAPVSAEVDYVLGKVDQRARRAFLSDLAAGLFRVECLEAADYETVRAYDLQYKGLNVGLADISVVVLAHRFGTKRILTIDQRHFRALRPLDGGSFTLLPYDL